MPSPVEIPSNRDAESAAAMIDETTGVIPTDMPSTPRAKTPEAQRLEPASPDGDAEPAACEAHVDVAEPDGVVTDPTPSPAASQDSDAFKPILGWMPRDLLFLCVAALIVLGLMGWKWARLSGWGAEPIEIERLESRRLDYKIDINTATWVEWVQFDGIGEKLADRIVADRKENGPFKSIDDLQRVKGIGPKKIERIREHLKVGPSSKTLPARH